MSTTRKKTDLRPYQTHLAEEITKKPSILLSVDMGLGKSAATLTALRQLLDSFLMPPTQALVANQPWNRTWVPVEWR